MPNNARPHIGLAIVALVTAAALFSLAAEYRPDGFLGELQSALQFMFVLPYLLGVAFAGGVHTPSAIGIFAGLCIETYGLALLAWHLIMRISAVKAR